MNQYERPLGWLTPNLSKYRKSGSSEALQPWRPTTLGIYYIAGDLTSRSLMRQGSNTVGTSKPKGATVMLLTCTAMRRFRTDPCGFENAKDTLNTSSNNIVRLSRYSNTEVKGRLIVRHSLFPVEKPTYPGAIVQAAHPVAPGSMRTVVWYGTAHLHGRWPLRTADVQGQ